jgi:hypothetical protein
MNYREDVDDKSVVSGIIVWRIQEPSSIETGNIGRSG